MLRHARMLVLSVGALALAATGCASVPPGSIEAEAVACPEGSDCYDVPRALGDGGAFTIDAFEFGFDEPEGTFWAGDIEVTIQNTGDAEHNIVVIDANEGSEMPIQALGGESASGVINLFEGEYVFFCSIPGHRSQGMEGTLTVFPTEDEASENLTESDEATDDATDEATDDATDEATDAATEG